MTDPEHKSTFRQSSLKCSCRILLLLLVAACLGGGGCSDRDRAEPRNVLLLFIDTLRADRMSVYGYQRRTTPRIEEFAATGALFEKAYSPSSWTRASFASYFTGLYPSAHACEGRHDILDTALTTLAERFRKRGFVTTGIHSNANIAASFGFNQGFDTFEQVAGNAGGPENKAVADASAVNERVLRWLRNERSSEPWFLFVLYMDPHDPYLPHAQHRFGRFTVGPHVGSRKALRALEDLTNSRQVMAVRRDVMNLYDGEIAYVDQHIGELLAALAQEGLTDDTVVVLASDHGEGLWDHGDYRRHGLQVYESQIHVPLIIRWPGRTKPGSRIAYPVSVLDLFGALAEAYDLADTSEYQAGSLLPELQGERQPRPAYLEEKLDGCSFRVIIDWPWKLIIDNVHQRYELFDLAMNPQEQDTCMDAFVINRMRAAIDRQSSLNAQWRQNIVWSGKAAELSEEDKRSLRALGYIH